MAAIAFDTLSCARRLIAAGIPEQQADVLAELMAQAFVHNVDQLVTKDYLDARFDAFESRINQQFVTLEKQMDERFALADQNFAKIEGKFQLLYWMMGVVIATTVLPTLASFFGPG
ncbi:hypothetical protein FV139_18035 [Parahaliea maris]|uniref:DUF1640 domain-containing protein n=1 Tax=Parahaliea maris TaxID=2716870 RepID=A0A5C8ZTT2_9GAMM|nr:hypothetical protein [Parahaliea maris]TXS90867.1 hypothetical protein FV139_18035 [Parahaliea maris]